jgi:hypothetical protein
MTKARQNDDAALEALFEVDRAAPPEVPDALMQRVMADAVALQPAAPRSVRKSILARMFDAVGRAPAIGGLVTATCVGFWLGVAPPDGVPDFGAVIMGVEQDVFVAELDGDAVIWFGWDFEEGEADG